jgi:hypothetical protein
MHHLAYSYFHAGHQLPTKTMRTLSTNVRRPCKTTTHSSVSVLPTTATRHHGDFLAPQSQNLRQTSRKALRVDADRTESRHHTLEEVVKICHRLFQCVVVAFDRVERRAREESRAPAPAFASEQRTAGEHPRRSLDRYVTAHHPLN